MPRKLLVGGVQRNGTLKGITIKKVLPPTVPDLPCKLSIHSSTYIPNGDDVTEGFDDPCLGIESEDVYALPPPRSPCSDQNLISPCAYSSLYPPMKKMAPGDGPNGQIHVAHVIVHSQPDSLPSTPVEASHSPYLTKGRFMSGTQGSLEDQGIDVSPGRHSPGGSSGGSSISRHSLSSIDSGRASAPGNDTKVVNRRLSVQSYESGGGSPQRRSYHSSSSSIASGEDLGQGPNVAEMVLHGLPDVEVLSSWLSSLHFEEYIPLFLQAGYDMPTITRMTPEDLTAVGVTKPNHRRKLKAEIAKLNISDGIPEYKPNTLLEWLQLLRLEEYYGTLCQQGYDTVDKVTELTWEDLEDIGIQKLGHQKKILLAIKRVEDINQGRRPNLVPEPPAHMQMHATLLQDASSTLPRPSTLGTIQPYHYPCQEIAIATHRPKNSPSTDSIPEMKTFQQSPIKEDYLLHSSTQSVTTASQQQNGNISQVLSPCRGRSLESLNAEDGAMMTSQMPPVSYNPSYQPAAEPPKVQSRDWRVTDLDTDHGFDCDGTATLNRPKGLVKFRPVAKISAKTREEIAEAILDIPDKDFKLLLNQSRTLDGWSSLDGSPRHGPATVPRASTLKRAPPPPPKRSNSTKGERVVVEVKRDESFASKLPSQCGQTSERAPMPVPLDIDTSSPPSEEFPPPPSPLPSAVEFQQRPKQASVGEKSEPLDELFNNPLFKQRRKDSAESSSSVESANLPFANENVGTIKQKASRPYPALPVNSSPSETLQRADLSGLRSRSNPDNTTFSAEEHEYDTTPDAISPGDVIDDIENMLANLSDQLDAMLDNEQAQK